jgi:hemerythrin-like domain-containing protein
MKITEALQAEHVVFHHMFDYLETAAPKLKTLAEIKAVARLMDALLEAHSEAEDKLVLEPLDHCLDQLGQRELFHQEHEEIDRHLAEIPKARTVRKARAHLVASVLASRRHFDKEERAVFPLAERVLKSKTLNTLGKTWMEKRKHAVAR